MGAEKYTLGIDIGSSFIKAAVFSSQQTRMLWKVAIPAQEKMPNANPHIFELDANQLFETIKGLVNEAAACYPIEGLLLSTQMHGFVYRTPDRPDVYVSWQDARCTDVMPGTNQTWLDYLKSIISSEDIEPGGVPLKPSLALSNLFVMIHSGQKIAENGELFTLGSYINTRLGGSNRCHLSNAGPLGLVDVPSRDWNWKLIKKLGFERIVFPDLAQHDFQSCGQLEINGHQVQLYPDFGDQQVSVLGAMAEASNVVINIATAGQISCYASEFRPGEYEIRPYFEDTFINTISNMPAGRNLAVLTDFLEECALVLCGERLSTQEVWDKINRQFQNEKRGLKADILIYPTSGKFDGGGIAGIMPDNLTINGLFTAAYEHTASIYEEAIGQLLKGERPVGLTFSGGVSWKNPVLIDMVAKRMGLPYKKSVLPNEAFNGLFRLSLAATGEIKILKDQPERILSVNEEEEK
ncbi:FGGY family carbohydrate kinase [Neobacillus niacini]|uniref:sedoheptulokinase n=1 Tax=Neobacillus niacini TaxID=86668 RepID=UPI0030001B6E